MSKNKYESELLLRLKEIHPDMKDCRCDEDGFFEILLESGEVMSSTEFKTGSKTRRLIRELERLKKKFGECMMEHPDFYQKQDDNYDYECDDVRHYCGGCGCEPCQCGALSHAIENGKTFVVTGEMVNNEILRLQKDMNAIHALSFAAWEQVVKNPEEARRLFKKIHSIASGGEYMMEHPSFYPENDKPDEDVLDDEEETVLNKLCGVVEAECFGENFDYDRKRMKKELQKILDGEDDIVEDEPGTNELLSPNFYAQKDYYTKTGKWPDEKCPTCGDPEFGCHHDED